jgi:hypothetical protein
VLGAGWPVRIRATEDNELTREQAAKLRGDVIDALAKQRLRDLGIFQPTYVQYSDAAVDAQQTLEQEGGI